MRLLIVLASMILAACTGVTAMDTNEPWDLVWFSDSTGFGVADLWGARIEQELGIEVRVNDKAAGGLSAAQVLEWIGDGNASLPKLKEQLAEAEVIVIYGNPEESGATTDIGTCVSTSKTPRDPPTSNSAEDWEAYREVLDSIYQTIFDLRGNQPTIVRAMDMYNPVLADWREAGIEEGCTAAWAMMAQTVNDAAADYNIPTASVFEAFNGPNRDEDPRVKGFIGPDGQHTTYEGKAAIVEVFHALGYEPVDR